jgi:uncharacterized protein (TIGR02145 family)
MDSFTWGVNNKKYEVSGTYTEVKGCLTEKLVLKVTYTDGIIPPSVLNNRNPDSRKDFANVYFDPRYTLFDFWSDEPILPDENGLYHLWISDNETRIPLQFDGNAEKLSHSGYKFRNYNNCKNWCDNIPYSNTTNTNPTSKTQTFKEVKIGNQIWMKENLNVDHFRNGDPIPYKKNIEEWGLAEDKKEPAWCYHNFNPKNGDKYGKLYNWYAVDDQRGFAPIGYHIPTIGELDILIEYLGVGAVSKMKSSNGWNTYKTGGFFLTCENCSNASPEYKKICPICKGTQQSEKKHPVVVHSGNGNNSSGFSALPGGACYGKYFTKMNNDSGNWWLSNPCNGYEAKCFQISSDSNRKYCAEKTEGFSIRCIKD